MQNSLAKKIFAVGVAGATALMSFAPLAAHAAAHAAGTNVKSSDGTIWMISLDGQRRAYTSAGAFLSYGFNSFASVVDANAEDLALPAGSFIPPQDGSITCSDRGSDKGTCYFISSGMKYGFTSAAVFTGLGFSFTNAKSGDVSWMAAGASLINSSSMQHMTGALINKSGTVYLVGASGLLGIPDPATFNSWGYSFKNVVPANAADGALTQTGVMTMRTAGQLSPSWTGTPTAPVVSGNVSAALASDSPLASTIVASSSAVTLAKFAFTGSGSVTQLVVKRTGVSADTVLSNVYLYDGASRLTDAASVGGSSLVTFSNPAGLFTVSGSKTISVVAEIAGNASSGQTVGVQLTSFTVANGTAAVVSVSGSLHTISSVSDLATISFGTVTPTGGSFDPAADVEVFRSTVSVGTRNVTLSRLAIRQIGSVNTGDIKNFRLRIDGTQVASASGMDANGYVNFVFSPVTLQSGSRIVNVLADVVGGSSRNFQFQIRNKVDVDFTDSNYGVTLSPSTSFPVGSASSNSINSGSLTFQKASDSPSSDVTYNASGAKLAKYTVTAYGEAMKIETLTVGATSSDATVGSLRNGRVTINGVQYGSTATLSKTTNNTYTTGGTSFTLNYTVQPGTPVTLEVWADAYDNDGTDNLSNGDTITAYVMQGSSNVQRMTSLGYTNGPSASVAGNSISIVTGSMTLTKNSTYANQTTPLPQYNYKLGAFSLAGSSSEDITISSVDIATVASTTLSSLNDVKLMVNGNMFGTIKSTVAITSGGTSTSTFSGNYTLPKNTSVTVEVWGTVTTPTSDYASDTIKINAYVTGTTVNSSSSVTAGAQGQTISVGTSSVTAAQDPSTPVAAITAGNLTKTAAAFKFTTTNDQFTIKELTFSLNANTTVNNIILKDGSTVIATKPGSASTTFSGLSINVGANTTKVLTVDLELGTVGVGAGTSGENVKVTLHSYKHAALATGTQTTVTNQVVSGNNLYVYKSIPTITNVALPTGTLVAGTNTLAKFAVSSGGTGTIGWTRFVFTYSTSANVTLSSPTLWDADSNTQITASSSVNVGKITVDAASEQQISGAKNYILKATVGGTLAAASYVTTNIAQPTSFVAPTTAATATGTSASFVWSDLSAQSHALTTSDWNNDFLVKNLPTDSQTLTQ